MTALENDKLKQINEFASSARIASEYIHSEPINIEQLVCMKDFIEYCLQNIRKIREEYES